jgi:hypothetical protein
MNLLNKIDGIQEIGFPGSRSSAPDINTNTSAGLADDDRATRCSVLILCMSYLNAFDFGKIYLFCHIDL